MPDSPRLLRRLPEALRAAVRVAPLVLTSSLAAAQAPSVVDTTPEPPLVATWPEFDDDGADMAAVGSTFANQGTGRGQAWVDLVGPDPADPTNPGKLGPPDGIPDLYQVNSNSPGLPLSAGAGSYVVPPVGTDPYPAFLYRGLEDGKFLNVAGLANVEPDGFSLRYPGGSPWGAIAADFDDDGDQDVFVPCGGFNMGSPNALLRNDGNGKLANVGPAVGFTAHQSTFSGLWFDYDRDGDLDLFETNAGVSWLEFFLGPADPDPTDRLYRNDGLGGFQEVGAAAEVDLKSNGFACTASDLDRDGWPDLVVSCFRQLNKVFYNDGDGTFSFMAPQQQTGVQVTMDGAMVEDPGLPGTEELLAVPSGYADLLPILPQRSMPVEVEDVNGDGWPDIYFSSWSSQVPDGWPFGAQNGAFSPWEYSALYLNRGDQDGDGLGDGLFREVAEEVGIPHVGGAMGLGAGDFNGDGYLDFYLGGGGPTIPDHVEEDYLYVNDGSFWPADFQADPDQPLPRIFYEVGALVGTYDNTDMSHGVTPILRDSGRIDVLIGNGGPAATNEGQPNVYWRNEGNDGDDPYRLLEVELAPSVSVSYGEVVEVIRTAPPGHGHRSVRERVSGSSFASSDTRALTFGLGGGLPLFAEARWPSGRRGGTLLWPAQVGASQLTLVEPGFSAGLDASHHPDGSTTLRVHLEQHGPTMQPVQLVYLRMAPAPDPLGLPVLQQVALLGGPISVSPGSPLSLAGTGASLPEGLHALWVFRAGTLNLLNAAAVWHDPAAVGAQGPTDPGETSLPFPWKDGWTPGPERPAAGRPHVNVGRTLRLRADAIRVADVASPTTWARYELGEPGSLALATGDELVWDAGELSFVVHGEPADLSTNDGYVLLTSGGAGACCASVVLPKRAQWVRFEGLEGPLRVDGRVYDQLGALQVPDLATQAATAANGRPDAAWSAPDRVGEMGLEPTTRSTQSSASTN